MSGKMNVRSKALLIFGVICIAYLFVAFHRVSPAIMATDIMGDTGVSPMAMGALASTFFITFGLMQLPGGVLADSWGPRRTLPLFLLLAGTGAILFSQSSTIIPLGVGRALMGFGVSVTFVCGLKILTSWFPTAYFARLNGFFLGMGGLGLILGSGPLALLCDLTGWRVSMLLCGICTLAIAALIWTVVRDSPEEAGYPPVNPDTSVDKARAVPALQSIRAMFPVIGQIFSSANFWFISVWFCAQFAMHMAFGGLWAGAYLMEVHGLSKTAAGNVLFMMGIGMLAGAPFNGWLSDVVFTAKRKPIMLISSVVTIFLFIYLAFFAHKFSHRFLYLWFFLLAAFGMGSLSAGFAAMRDLFGPSCTSTASGFLNTSPSFIVALLQMLSGFILESFPKSAAGFPPEAYAKAALIYLVTACISLGAALMVREARKIPATDGQKNQEALLSESPQHI